MLMFLVRHAESTWNRQKKIQGQRDPQLSPYGTKEAKLLAKRFKGLEFEAVYSSPLKRAQGTARAIVGKRAEVQCIEELTEINLGEWEGRTLNQIRRKFGDSFDRWAVSPSKVQVPGGEDFKEFKKRVGKVMRGIERKHREGNVLVVCHGGVISTYATTLLNLPPDDVWCLTVKNASLTIVEIGLDIRKLITFNDISHLMTLKEIRMSEVTHVD
ncbi:histidine phosphatase family protein [Candidatus Eisenbacteria bacterium]|uniref:Histidine phosphatase family protein n=1 Tax=Eiseniibacteriota bacterium TaxID=2212470 RepID=A0ABV6YPX2_UNCEI